MPHTAAVEPRLRPVAVVGRGGLGGGWFVELSGLIVGIAMGVAADRL